jgi:hypothetical protein
LLNSFTKLLLIVRSHRVNRSVRFGPGSLARSLSGVGRALPIGERRAHFDWLVVMAIKSNWK